MGIFPMRIRPVLSGLALALGMAHSPAFALDLAEAYAKARQNDPNWSAARNSFEASFAPAADKAAWIARLDRAFALAATPLTGHA